MRAPSERFYIQTRSFSQPSQASAHAWTMMFCAQIPAPRSWYSKQRAKDTDHDGAGVNHPFGFGLPDGLRSKRARQFRGTERRYNASFALDYVLR